MFHFSKSKYTSFIQCPCIHSPKTCPPKQEIARRDLLKYCELDTYAMVKIWQRLKELSK